MFFFSLSLFSYVTFVAMLDTEHCVLFDLHVRDRKEYQMIEQEEEDCKKCIEYSKKKKIRKTLNQREDNTMFV